MKKNFKESISLSLRKKWITSNTKTLLLIAILIVLFLILNLWKKDIDLPQIDVTENKIYTLSEASINSIKKIDKDVKVYVYGYAENDSVVDLLKQYVKNNSYISYEIITDETNLELVKKYELESGNKALIVEVGEMNKILYDSEFVSYDYTTSQQIDLKENAITNALLNLTIANKPKIYFLTGHDELNPQNYLSILLNYLQNEVFDYDTLNLLTVNSIPEDCDLIAIMSPQKDLIDQEVLALESYINNGGNIIMTSDLYTIGDEVQPNWQRILNIYGASIKNGAVYETDSNRVIVDNGGNQYNTIFLPQIEANDITAEIYTSGAILLEFAKEIVLPSEEKLTELNLETETLLKTSENSYLVTEFPLNEKNLKESQTPETKVISAKITKKFENTSEEEEKKSSIILISNGTFVTNVESMVAAKVSNINVYNNADFFISCISNLTDRKDTVSVRKEMNSSTYTPTQEQNKIVLAIIFSVPILIIFIGIIVWNYRKHKR